MGAAPPFSRLGVVMKHVRVWSTDYGFSVRVFGFRVNVSRSRSAGMYRDVQYRVSWRPFHGTLRGFTFGVTYPRPYRPSYVDRALRDVESRDTYAPWRCDIGDAIMRRDRDGNTECPIRESCVRPMHGGYDACYAHDAADALPVAWPDPVRPRPVVPVAAPSCGPDCMGCDWCAAPMTVR